MSDTNSSQVIQAFPAKRFFVDMLTRDIELLDAVLDLIDNSLDGAMRDSAKENRMDGKKYQDYKVDISFDSTHFCIEDNCGGIPKQVAIHSAFRMGRPSSNIDADLPTVGVYGIGMKRSIFKMGRKCTVTSTTGDIILEVNITPEWMARDDDWELPYTETSNSNRKSVGTKIHIEELKEGIKRSLGHGPGFFNDLKYAAEVYYSSFIEQGFKISIKGQHVSSNANILAIEENFLDKTEAISPYVYVDHIDGVDISVMIGFYRSFASTEEEEDALQGHEKAKSVNAGVTIICNDRVVLHADKTRVTGWGSFGVPSYHTQFVAITGVVRFQSKDPSKLPLTTTKRGIEGNSEIYLKVKDRIMEGLKLFTNFTNKWKSREGKEALSIQSGKSIMMTTSEFSSKIPEHRWIKIRGQENTNAKKFIPDLPMPPKNSTERRISFSRPIEEINKIAEFYFEDNTVSPKEVGEKCFDESLKRAN
jgi:hypothetical protein